MTDGLKTKIYKLCEERCMTCSKCSEFIGVVQQIDLSRKSKIEAQRLEQNELRKGER